MGESSMIQIVSPVAKPLEKRSPLAQRPLELNGKRLGLLGNGKPGAIALIDALGGLLKDRYNLSEIIRQDRVFSGMFRARLTNTPDEVLDQIGESADVVINAIGD
jgi:hypothetical protein